MKHIRNIVFIALLPIFVLQAQNPTELKAWLPSISGWNISDKIEIFNSDNLFDRINGSAPLFIENNFREMTSMEYTKGDDYITIQAYRHATPEDAFGMYASERSSDLKYYPIGGEAQGNSESMYFFARNIYVKMTSSTSENIENTLQSIAQGLANKIDPQAGYPTIVKIFPSENKIPYSEAYITSNYIGHEFLKGAFTCKYEIGENKFQLFVIDAKTENGAKEMLDKYFSFTKQPLDFQQGRLTINDRYNGDIPVIWKSQYIIGLFSENGEPLANSGNLLDKLSHKL